MPQTPASSRQTLEELHRDRLAGLDLAALVLEHDEAVRLRHRAQHAGALLAGGAYFPFAAFAEQDAALVLGSPCNLSQRLRGGCLEQPQFIIACPAGEMQHRVA